MDYENKDLSNVQNPYSNIVALNVDMKVDNHFIDNNLNKKEKIIFIIKIITAILYFIFIICIENLYRDPLFSKSITIQESIRKKHEKNSSFYQFWEFMSLFGLAKITFPIFAIIFLFFPLSSSYLTLQVLIYSIYVTNLFKIIYRNGRPYWYSDILDIVCNSGYGNPSGHSLTSAAFYPTLPHIFTNFAFFKKDMIRKILRIIIFVLFHILGFLVMISRVILAAHSLNQIIYGFTLGIGIYFIMVHIISYHTLPSISFIKHIKRFPTILIYMSIHITLLVALIILYFVIDDDKVIKEYVYRYIYNGIRCERKKEYLMLKNDGFFQALAITSMLGAHLGMIILIFLLNKFNYIINEYIVEFNKSSVKRWFLRLPVLLLSGIFILLNFFVSGSNDLSIVFLFKSAISFFLTTLGLFSLGIFLCIRFNIANENIEKMK